MSNRKNKFPPEIIPKNFSVRRNTKICPIAKVTSREIFFLHGHLTAQDQQTSKPTEIFAQIISCHIGGGRGGAGGGACPPLFCRWYLFLHANARHSKPKVASRCRHAANVAFNLFNIFLYVIARKVRKCPLSPFVTSNFVLSCLVRMADILARLAQKAHSLSALQLTGALCYSLSNTPIPPIHSHPQPPPPPPPPHFLDRSAVPVSE